MPNPTKKPAVAKPTKPKKPRLDFPLFAHLSGQWAKEVRGHTYYFGVWSEPEGAMNKWLDEKDDIYAGRTPTRSRILTIKGLGNDFLRHCRAKVDAGEMVERTLIDYTAATDRLVRVLGKRQSVEGLRPKDFARTPRETSRPSGSS